MLSFAPTPRRVNRQSHPYTVSRGVLSTYAISSILFSCFRWIAPNNRNLGLAFFSCGYIVFNCCKETSGKNCFPLARFHILITSKTKEFKDKLLFKSFEIKEISYKMIICTHRLFFLPYFSRKYSPPATACSPVPSLKTAMLSLFGKASG